ncbi:hypothetical protein F1643_00145 [Azospirillum sp. INR13]|uniref:hypothetical protein n=1 Tax=Azospirillum sp. INR13 TaxID=2596919 RepID=UPI00189247EB|nr:hypothetical protein [Azospirillum sp. INR13]MBF5093099.1 hypothetical protein [Azospirillum sp. INR13]
MPSTTNADDLPETGERSDRLAGLADRTSLMAIDATLRTLGAPLNVNSAASVADIARRMKQATCDFRTVMREAAE